VRTTLRFSRENLGHDAHPVQPDPQRIALVLTPASLAGQFLDPLNQRV
jgi:hypothetical protein